jgi:hypothetical protein
LKSCVYLVYKLRYKYFRFGGRHLGFRHSVTSDIVYDMAIDLSGPENTGLAFGIVFPSSLQAAVKYKYFRFGGRHLGFRYPVTSDICMIWPLTWLTPKTWIYPLESCFYLVYKLRYKYFRFGGRHLRFQHPVTSDIMYDMAIDLVDPRNMGLAR